MAKANQLIADCVDELGIDLYYFFDTEKRLLTDAQQAAIVVALIVGFLKGFLGFEKLGEVTRDYLLGLLKKLYSKEEQTDDIRVEQVEALLEETARCGMEESAKAQARDDLKDALRRLGLVEEKKVDEYARTLELLIVESVERRS